MAKTPIVLNQPLRKVRAKNVSWIKQLLHKVPFGMLATEYQGQPFIKPINFAYAEEENAIYFHGALRGNTPTNLEANPKVSFCVAEMGRLLPAKAAKNVGVEYASVVVLGRAEVITDPVQVRHGLQLLLDRYFPQFKPGVDYREIQEQDLKTTAVYRINIESWSGKEEHARSDFPDAFFFPPPPGGIDR